MVPTNQGKFWRLFPVREKWGFQPKSGEKISNQETFFQNHFQTYYSWGKIFSCASAKAERGLSSLSCVWMYVDQNQGTPPPHPEMAYPLEFLDFKSRFGFTTKIYPRLIFLNGCLQITDTNLFLILQNYLRPSQQWMPLSSPNHSAN